jgi:FkbM family methyltransferase
MRVFLEMEEIEVISYAQNFEDVILWRTFRHIKNGFYIDIGAHDPVNASVSKVFYDSGWRGVNVEPVKYYADKLRAERPNDEVIEVAVGASTSFIKFYEIAGTGDSTASPENHELYATQQRSMIEHEVLCVPTESILDKFKGNEIHWLKIDVEGYEKNVLKGWGQSVVRPWVLVIEATKPYSPEPNHEDWEPIVLALGYEFVYFDGLNRFYVSIKHRELAESLRIPPNLFDNFELYIHLEAIKNRDAEIQRRDAEIQRRDIYIANSSDHLAVVEAAFESNETKLKILSKANSEALVTIERFHQVNKNLETIYASRSWRIVNFLRKLNHKLTPRGSVRRKVIGFFGRPIKFVLKVIWKIVKIVTRSTRQKNIVEGFVAAEAVKQPRRSGGLKNQTIERPFNSLVPALTDLSKNIPLGERILK